MSLVPTGRQVTLWSVPLLLAVLAVAVPAAWPVIWAADGAIVVLLLADAWTTLGTARATRTHHDIVPLGQDFEIEVVLEVPGGAWIEAVDEAPGRTVPLTRGVVERATVTYAHQIDRRGRHAFGDVVLRRASWMGFWWRQLPITTPSQVDVYPDFRQLTGVDLKGPEAARLPSRARRRPGGESEFQRNRPYVPGDPYRHIDWRGTARHGKLVSREYGQESNQNIVLLLDAGRMMSAPFGGLTAFDHALNGALRVGAAALRQGDRVALLAFDSEVRAWLPPKGGVRSQERLLKATYDLYPSQDEPNPVLAYGHLAQHVRRRSLIVLFTTLVDRASAESVHRLVQGLRRRHLALVVWIRDPAIDEALAGPPDEGLGAARMAAAAELARLRAEVLRDLRRVGATVVDVPVAAMGAAALGRYLEIKARSLL